MIIQFPAAQPANKMNSRVMPSQCTLHDVRYAAVNHLNTPQVLYAAFQIILSHQIAQFVILHQT